VRTTIQCLPLLIGLAAGPLIAQTAGSGTSLAGSGTSAGTGASFIDEARAKTASSSCTRCGERTFGTAIEWVTSPPEAARRAQAEGKLVFVLHVSGHFENAGYT
jgi:hypothetical protein